MTVNESERYVATMTICVPETDYAVADAMAANIIHDSHGNPMTAFFSLNAVKYQDEFGVEWACHFKYPIKKWQWEQLRAIIDSGQGDFVRYVRTDYGKGVERRTTSNNVGLETLSDNPALTEPTVDDILAAMTLVKKA